MVLWSPDTCGCVLKLNDSDFSLNQIIKACPAHSDVWVLGDILTTVFDENHLKNDTMTVLKEIPELTTTNERGQKVFKEGEVSFELEGKAPNRTIRIITKTDISSHEAEIQDQIPDADVSVKSLTKSKSKSKSKPKSKTKNKRKK